MTGADHSIQVDTTSGTLRGEALAEPDVAVFRGIPFAAPPVGDLRFRPPAPATPWDGVRDATAFGPVAVQGARGGQLALSGAFGVGEDRTMSEDCLTLNVWTPGLDDRCRPVMVWIHGGAFRMGSGSSPVYDGRHLAARGDVVVVSCNYRLGLLGFLASTDLDVANCGLLDQIAALEWVQREIARFGGDPDNVTVFGESAGGKSVECLMAMPAARGLFTRAIAQSTYDAPMNLDRASDRARAIAAELGIEPTEMERLRNVPVNDLLDAEQRVAAASAPPGVGGGGGGPIVDGVTLPVAPIDAIRRGDAAAIPLIVGTTLDEARLFAGLGGIGQSDDVDEDRLGERLLNMMGVEHDDDTAAKAIDAYRAARIARDQPAEPADLLVDAMSDRMFRQHSIRVAEAAAEHQPDTYMYLFTWESPVAGGRLGACHAVELGFVFGTLDAMARFAGTGPDAEALSAAVMDAWLAFAHGRQPGAAALPQWHPFEVDSRRTMVLGGTPELVTAPLDAIRQIWQEAVT